MSFLIYDISLSVLFVIFVSIFLYKRRKKLKREGLLFLYRTKRGIKLIDYIGNKCKKTLKVLSFFSIALGYFLMGVMFYLFIRIVWIYLFHPNIVREIKVPPIMPLIPYLPQIFKLDFLPPFYFIYWIIIIAIIAITHEFSHGIFATYSKVRIKNTGFGFFPFFLPVFLAAFVELDEKKMAKKSKFSQLSILSAGTFANILTALFFFFILWAFLSLAFTPAGINFDSYSYSIVPISSILSVNGVAIENPTYEKILDLVNEAEVIEEKPPKKFFQKIINFFKEKKGKETEISKIETNEGNYFITKEFLTKQTNTGEYLFLYDDSPAINAELKGAITEINGVKINSREKLVEEIIKYSPKDEIKIITILNSESFEYSIVLGEHPENKTLPWLGIGFSSYEKTGIIGKIVSLMSLIKKLNVYYEPKFSAGLFIYNLLWWIVLISLGVALMNMLPVGIFDGGRFLFLTVLAITRNEKRTKSFFKFLTYAILFLAFLIMAFWFLGIFGKV